MIEERLFAEAALAARAEAGRPLQLWWRDDDAVAPDPALDRLLALANAYDAPLTLAVVPAPWDHAAKPKELSDRLLDAPSVRVAVHGWSHRDHAPPGQKRQELHPDRPLAQMRDELRQGLAFLHEWHGPRAMPLLVPPWNRIAQQLLPHIAEDGFATLSSFGPEAPVPGLDVINTHLDVIDWKRNRLARDESSLWRELRLIAQSDRSFAGLLTHHLVHDEATWAFLAAFLETTRKGRAEWRSVSELARAAS